VRDSLEFNVKTLQVDEITVFMTKLKCPGSVLINAEVSKYAWIMNFTLSGQLTVQGMEGDVIKLAENSHQTLLSLKAKADMVITGDINLFLVCLSGSAVKRLLSADEEMGLQKRLNQQPGWLPNRLTTPAMQHIIATVIKCSENNCLHRIFLAAKMLELLFLDMEQLINNKDQPRAFPFKINDLEKLEKAKILIGENMQAPCSLIELAHKVGLNDFKLKKGFKEAYGTTVFGHLLELRMEKAKTMLSSARYTVSEVAYEVGYKNAHHFTVAFKKRFGYLPSKHSLK